MSDINDRVLTRTVYTCLNANKSPVNKKETQLFYGVSDGCSTTIGDLC